MTVGEKIKQARKIKKLTQAEFAKKLDVSVPTLQRYENGVTELKPSTINKIAEALEVDINVLLSDDEPKKVYSAADLFSGVGFSPDMTAASEEKKNLKSVTIEQNGQKYYFTVATEVSNEELEKAIRMIASLFADKDGDKK